MYVIHFTYRLFHTCMLYTLHIVCFIHVCYTLYILSVSYMYVIHFTYCLFHTCMLYTLYILSVSYMYVIHFTYRLFHTCMLYTLHIVCFIHVCYTLYISSVSYMYVIHFTYCLFQDFVCNSGFTCQSSGGTAKCVGKIKYDVSL